MAKLKFPTRDEIDRALGMSETAGEAVCDLIHRLTGVTTDISVEITERDVSDAICAAENMATLAKLLLAHRRTGASARELIALKASASS